jgi:hypothetical protein
MKSGFSRLSITQKNTTDSLNIYRWHSVPKYIYIYVHVGTGNPVGINRVNNVGWDSGLSLGKTGNSPGSDWPIFCHLRSLNIFNVSTERFRFIFLQWLKNKTKTRSWKLYQKFRKILNTSNKLNTPHVKQGSLTTVWKGILER